MTSHNESGSNLYNELPNTIEGILWRMRCELTCPICLQMLSDAKSTPCGHTYCKECIEHAFRSGQSVCPVCKQSVSRRALRDAKSIDLIVQNFSQLRSEYEKDIGYDLSQQVPMQHQQEWKTEPIANLSQKFPYPTKEEPTENNDEVPRTLDTDATEVTSLEIRQVNERLQQQPQQYVIMCSVKTIEEQNVFNELVKKYPNVQKTENVDEATCLVVSTKDDNKRVCSRTVKYLQAMLMGISIVNQDWMAACLEMNQMVPMDEYLILHDKYTTINAPQRIREQLTLGNKLFKDLDFYLLLSSGNQQLIHDDIKSIIELAGGRVVASPDELSSMGEIICFNKMTRKKAHDYFKKYGKNPLSFVWITHCIGIYKLVDRQNYINDAVDEDNSER
ncbi:hypothetical protein BDA99DRAFT_516075 [Phascolomyces articulosus]|uniref:RING-type E3 ubiquitin transferase BRCA1 n=1 Tax=Phascolomyces articulosus TaxID=60185 RepID=A0AAD5PC84_9FUNG|nr:hypothetical protein BDA99DRAFT_516075 [Phascolomyces articulosus]